MHFKNIKNIKQSAGRQGKDMGLESLAVVHHS